MCCGSNVEMVRKQCKKTSLETHYEKLKFSLFDYGYHTQYTPHALGIYSFMFLHNEHYLSTFQMHTCLLRKMAFLWQDFLVNENENTQRKSQVLIPFVMLLQDTKQLVNIL